MQTLQRLLLFCSSFLFYCSIIIKNSFWFFFLPIGPQKPTTLLKVLRETHWGWNSQWWEQYTGKCQLLLKCLSCDSLQGSKRAAVVQAWQLCLLLWNLNSESQTKATLISCTMRETVVWWSFHIALRNFVKNPSTSLLLSEEVRGYVAARCC